MDATEREQLIVDHLPLVKTIARALASRNGLRSAECDDLVSAGAFGLIEVAQRYDPARGVPFRGYARRRILGAMLDYVRSIDTLSRRSRQQLRKLKAEPSGNDEPRPAALERELAALRELECTRPVAAVQDDELYRRELRALLLRGIRGLSKDQRSVVLQCYFGERSQDEIGLSMGVTQPYISRLHRDAMRRLREYCEGIGLAA